MKLPVVFGRLLARLKPPPLNRHYEQISGWFDYAAFYDEMIQMAPKGALFVEVGTHYGRSTCYLGARIVQRRKQIRVIAVDLFGGWGSRENKLEILRRNLCYAGCEHIVTPMPCDSSQAASKFDNRSVDFCFIDANHDYTKVKKDIRAWLPRIKHCGVIAGHDFHQTQYPGVDKAVQDVFGGRAEFVPPHVWKVKV